MSCKRGDVILVNFPYSDLTQVKRRPALVVQSDTVRNEHAQVIVAKISSNTARASRPGRVLVRRSDPLARGTGLRTDSVIAADHLATIHPSLIARAIGAISDMSLIDTALRQTLSL